MSKMNKTSPGKKLLKLEIKELCNETKPPLEIQFEFPSISDEALEKAQPEEKFLMISNYLKQQKQSYKDYRKIEQRLLENDHKKELFLLKYNTFDGFPKHPKVFQRRIKEQEIFSFIPFQSTTSQNELNSKKLQTKNLQQIDKRPWKCNSQYSNYFDEMSTYRNKGAKNVKLEQIRTNANKHIWENFTHPHEFFVKNDIDEWDLKIKRFQKNVGVFVPNTKIGGFFDKTIKDFS